MEGFGDFFLAYLSGFKAGFVVFKAHFELQVTLHLNIY